MVASKFFLEFRKVSCLWVGVWVRSVVSFSYEYCFFKCLYPCVRLYISLCPLYPSPTAIADQNASWQKHRPQCDCGGMVPAIVTIAIYLVVFKSWDALKSLITERGLSVIMASNLKWCGSELGPTADPRLLIHSIPLSHMRSPQRVEISQSTVTLKIMGWIRTAMTLLMMNQLLGNLSHPGLRVSFSPLHLLCSNINGYNPVWKPRIAQGVIYPIML